MIIRFLSSSLLILLFTGLKAQHADSAVTAVVQHFFDGLNATDTVVVKSTLSKNVSLETVVEGKEKLKEEPIDRFLISLAKDKPVHFEEEVLGMEVLSEQELAMVWAPYRFFINGQLVHCGVNLFTLIHRDDAWKIIKVVDTRRKDNCLPEE